jgi:hypothetical protein
MCSSCHESWLRIGKLQGPRDDRQVRIMRRSHPCRLHTLQRLLRHCRSRSSNQEHSETTTQETTAEQMNLLGVLGYLFDACRTCRMTAFARDLHLTRSGISARVAAVFFALFNHTGTGDVRTGVFLRCCHLFAPSAGNETSARHYSPKRRPR